MQLSTFIKTASASALLYVGAAVFSASSAQAAFMSILDHMMPSAAAASYDSADKAAVEIALPAQLITSGTFEGRSDHVTKGAVKIVKTDAGYELILGSDFSLDGAPDPVLGFGNSGEYVKASQFAKLDKKTGQQTYRLPASFTPGEFSEVYVWCEKFSVPLGVATLPAA